MARWRGMGSRLHRDGGIDGFIPSKVRRKADDMMDGRWGAMGVRGLRWERVMMMLGVGQPKEGEAQGCEAQPW